MTLQDVERIVRSVLRDFGLHETFRSVSQTAESWAVVLNYTGRPAIHLMIPVGTPHSVRRAVMAALAIED